MTSGGTGPHVAFPGGDAVAGGLLAVLGGLNPVGRRLQAVQRGLRALLPGGVATGSCSMTRFDQGSTVGGAQVTIATAPGAVDPREAPVQSRVLDRDDARRLVPLLGRPVTSPRRGVAVICRHVTRNRPRKDLIDLGVALDTAAVPFVRHHIPDVGCTVAPVSHRITLVRDPVTFVSHTVTLVSGTLPLTQLRLFPIVHSAHQHPPVANRIVLGRRGRRRPSVTSADRSR
jgi:hypothetical protein